MRFEAVPRLTTVLLHDSADGVRPSSGLELLQVGNLGVAYSLRGAGFYALLATSGLAPFRAIGVDTVLAAVSRVHLRAMRQRMRGATVRRLGSVLLGGHAFELAVIRADDATTPDPFEALHDPLDPE